jgi:hypothetical protein
LEGLKNTLNDTLELIESRSGDENVYKEQLTENNALELPGFFDGLRKMFEYPDEEPVMRKLRSTIGR